jgi:hypothetical protein
MTENDVLISDMKISSLLKNYKRGNSTTQFTTNGMKSLAHDKHT